MALRREANHEAIAFVATELRQDIRDFKLRTGVDKVIVLWTANTERFSAVAAGFLI